MDWGGCWYSAKVKSIVNDPNMSYCIQFTDGGEEMVVGIDKIRHSEGDDDDDVIETHEVSAEEINSIDMTGEDAVTSGGLVSELYRTSIGTDDCDDLSVHQLLGELGRLYVKLHNMQDSYTFKYINIGATAEEIEDEDIYLWKFHEPIECRVYLNLYATSNSVVRGITNDKVLLITAAKYFNAAFETAMEEGLRLSADKYIAEANKIERTF